MIRFVKSLRLLKNQSHLKHLSGEEDDSHYGLTFNRMTERYSTNPVDYTTRVVLREQLDEVLDTLTDREDKCSTSSGYRVFD
ncbi:RpoD [Streptococcus thermophilus CNCM I-1630]|nr:RpoD [Streptococcus thermophilus CNCM I-1630]